jgi:hypothetical protein
MATKKNISIRKNSISKLLMSSPIASNTTQADDTYTKLKALFQWRDNVDSDLSTVACREIAGGDEMFLNNIINALEESPMGETMIRDFQQSSNPNFDLLVFGARMYLAGKCSQQRYDDAAPQHVAVPMPHDPRPLRTAVAA